MLYRRFRSGGRSRIDSFAAENRICFECENWRHSPSQTERLLSIVTESIMPWAALLPLDTWQNFYVIVGTAAATLTGLMLGKVASNNLETFFRGQTFFGTTA